LPLSGQMNALLCAFESRPRNLQGDGLENLVENDNVEKTSEILYVGPEKMEEEGGALEMYEDDWRGVHREIVP
jgi:hypothetical protein